MRKILRTALAFAFAAAASPALAADGTWTAAVDNNFTDNGNWSAGVVPDGTAIFSGSATTALIFGGGGFGTSLQFDAGAPAYSFALTGQAFAILGAGIVNNSSNAPTFTLNNLATLIFNGPSVSAADAVIELNNGGTLNFINGANAASAAILVHLGGDINFTGTSAAGQAQFTIENGGAIVFGDSSNAGTATFNTTGGQIFFGSSSSVGNAIINHGGGMLSFNNSATAGSATIAVSDGGAPVNFNNSATAGAASISVANGATLTFYHTSSGGTAALTSDEMSTIDFSATAGPNNDKKVGFGSLSGDGTLYLGGNEVGIGGNNASTSFAGLIADCSSDCAANSLGLPLAPGTLKKTGAGALTLTGFNIYTGGTIIGTGQLTAGHNIALSSGTVTIENDAKLGFTSGGGFILSNFITLSGNAIVVSDGTDTNELAGPVEGTGALEKQGTGTLILSSPANSYGGGTVVTAGILKSGVDNAFGSGPITVAAGGAIDLNDNNQTAESLAGSGMVVLGSGRLTVSGNGSTVFSGDISGTGGLTKGGTGTLTLTGNHGYTGITVIASGTLQLGDGAASGTLATAAIDNSGNLTFNVPGDLNVTTPISGAGSVTKLGANTLTFATTQTYTGGTFVNAGTVVVNGTLSSIVTLASGATLKGSGTVAGIVANNGSFTAPGNSIDTLNVAGNVDFAAGATYLVEVNAAGQSDLINATGTAAILGGTVQVDTTAGYNPAAVYTIVTAAGGVNGTFAGLTIDNPALQAFLTYDATNVFLRVAPKALPPGATPNQIATQGGIGSGGTIFNALVGSSTANAQTAYTLLSGEIHATLLTSILHRRFLAAVPENDPGIYFWIHADQHWGSLEGDGNASGAHREHFNIMAGVDKDVAPGWRLGIEAGYGRENLYLEGRTSTADFGRGTVGAYFHGHAGLVRLRGGVAQMWGSVKTVRNVSFTGFNDVTHSKQDMDGTQAFIEAGYPTLLGSLPLEPVAGFSWARAGAGRARETGGPAALDVAEGRLEGLFSLLALQTNYAVAIQGELPLNLFFRAGWQHDFSADTVLRNVTLISTGGRFSVFGLQTDPDRLLIDFSATANLESNINLSFGYMGAHSANETDNALRAKFGWQF